ncbi:PilZ domain-containing protein [Roseomonas sp. PWR1]|uniref:PilZ domain-containing protein n=1 Tax=Roseomonas nitratireducens TaxID=2820810 RepID=A0ABS4ARE1_9PROT|nr:PilZ domain-containing protein [Neoroseomonas nitratireducens]MBP0463937.1 PilZ domain-containing protein [Neoroseomonas nitratireducens]
MPGPQMPTAPRGAMQSHGVVTAGRERRVHPRYPVDWTARAEWRGGIAVEGRVGNVSHGGALLVGVPPQAAGSIGTLRIEGIALPVPCRVVAVGADSSLHIAFELEGMGLEAFLARLDQRIAQGR